MPKGYCVHAWSPWICDDMSIVLYFLLLMGRDNMMERTKQIQLFCICPCFVGFGEVFLLPTHWFLKHLIS